MKKNIIFAIICILFIDLAAQIPELTIWNNIRNSSYTQDEQIHIRCETIELINLQTELYYLNDNEWNQTDMENISGLTFS